MTVPRPTRPRSSPPTATASARWRCCSPVERSLDDAEQALVAVQADQAAMAIQRTRERERDHEATTRLQRSLLPERLPEVDGLDVAARYNAGGAGLEIGGDWYDVVHRPDGLVHLTVGDVAGRGIGAAALMGQLRNAFRAYALDHASPGEIVQRLLRHVGGRRDGDGRHRHARPGLGRGAVRVGRASAAARARPSHRPGVAARRPGRRPRSARPTPGPVTEGHVQCAPGSTIVLYTDGLIEHRGASIDDGITQVSASLAAEHRAGRGRARRRGAGAGRCRRRPRGRHRAAGRALSRACRASPATQPADAGSTSVVGAGD